MQIAHSIHNVPCDLETLLTRVESAWTRLTEAQIKADKITVAQFKVITALGRFDCVSQATLALHLDMSSGAMSRMLERLRQKSLVSSSQAKHDRRQMIVTLTPEGLACARQLVLIESDIINLMTRTLDSAEVESLRNTLAKIVRHRVEPVRNNTRRTSVAIL